MNKKLRKELLRMVKEDKDMRMRALRKVGKWDYSVDKRNAKRMKEIIQLHGWPTRDLAGKDGSFAAWLLVQHADHNMRFQKKCLRLVEIAVKNGQADRKNLAYLTDRVLVNQGKKQLYGTQFYINKKGKFGPRPIRDKANLAKRLRKMGLEPFREYRKMISKFSKRLSSRK